MNETEKLLKDGDKFLILFYSILELIAEWKENYVPSVEKDTVPDILDFEYGDSMYTVGTCGDIHHCHLGGDKDSEFTRTHKVFKTPEMAEIYRDKTQVIADMLHFKQLYDADFEPDFSSANSEKYVLLKDIHDNQFVAAQTGMLYSEESVYFSTEEIAQKCADWLNEKRKRESK